MDAPHFVVLAGPDKDKILPVHPGSGHMLGRHQDAAYKLTDLRASRFHCEVVSENGSVAVVDRGGSGGTLVNGAKVAAHTLTHGDTVQIGETLLKFLVRPVAQAETVKGLSTGAEYDPHAVDELAALSGRTLTRYAIGLVLGRGTTSMVFRATDTEDGSAVALKVMQPAFARNEDDMQRFVRAMRAMMPLTHPNLVKVHAAGKNGPYCWAAMELVEGESLTEVIRRIGAAGMLDWKYAHRVGTHLARALAYAHGQGIIHRDISPANILMENATKTTKLADLMLAKAMEGTLAAQITKPGEIVGDVNYMSPERASGGSQAVDHRSDLFSLGATMYALLAGKPPFAGTNLIETITKIRTVEPLKPSTFQMGIPATFEGVVLKLLAKRPDERFPTAADLATELDRVGKANGATA